MIRFALHKPLAQQFIRFMAVGVAGLLADMAALAVALHMLHLNVYGGRVFSYLVAATFTWVIHRRVTFQDAEKRGAARQWLRYISVGAVGGLLNLAVYTVIVAATRQITALPAAWTPLIPYVGVACGSIAALFLNFSGARKLVFR